MKKVLVVSAHDTVMDSVATRYILDDLKARLPEATYTDLDTAYPDLMYTPEAVKAEQAKLEAADVIVLQFPFYWYSMPGALHRWMEFVLEHGWSHGSTGDALKGKTLIASCTTGAPDFLYAKDGFMRHSLEDYMAPFDSTCALTQMNWGGFVATCGVGYNDRKPENEAATREKLTAHVDQLLAKIQAL